MKLTSKQAAITGFLLALPGIVVLKSFWSDIQQYYPSNDGNLLVTLVAVTLLVMLPLVGMVINYEYFGGNKRKPIIWNHISAVICLLTVGIFALDLMMGQK